MRVVLVSLPRDTDAGPAIGQSFETSIVVADRASQVFLLLDDAVMGDRQSDENHRRSAEPYRRDDSGDEAEIGDRQSDQEHDPASGRDVAIFVVEGVELAEQVLAAGLVNLLRIRTRGRTSGLSNRGRFGLLSEHP